MLGYFALLAIFLVVLGISLSPGLVEWLDPRDQKALPVDLDYVRYENYFGASFRKRMQEWLQEGRAVTNYIPRAAGVVAVFENSAGENILVISPRSFRPQGECDELIYCDGDMRLPANSIYHREIYARGRLEIGPGVRLQAAAADGDLVIGAGCKVNRWLDSQTNLSLQKGTVVRSRASASESIALEPGVSMQSLFAPLIITSELTAEPDDEDALLPPGKQGAPPSYLKEVACTRLSNDTWLVSGNLDVPAGTVTHCNLVVRGPLHTGQNCFFGGDLKAGRVEIGSGNRIAGSIISDASLTIGENTKVRCNLIAAGDIRILRGARIGAGRLSAISAGGKVFLERNIAVSGKISSAKAVISL